MHQGIVWVMHLCVKLSLKVEYACRVLAQLGRYYGQEQWVHIDDLAQAESIPANYLVQILNELRNGGLIQSRRGKQGGYALAKAPKDIALNCIVRVVDAEMLSSNVSEDGQSGPTVAQVWKDIAKTFLAETQEYTLEDLMPVEAGEMYYI